MKQKIVHRIVEERDWVLFMLGEFLNLMIPLLVTILQCLFLKQVLLNPNLSIESKYLSTFFSLLFSFRLVNGVNLAMNSFKESKIKTVIHEVKS